MVHVLHFSMFLLCVLFLVKQFAASTRSRVYHVTVTDGSPKLVIACYAQGQTQRSLLSVWRTVTVLHLLIIVLVEVVPSMYVRI